MGPYPSSKASPVPVVRKHSTIVGFFGRAPYVIWGGILLSLLIFPAFPTLCILSTTPGHNGWYILLIGYWRQ